MKNKLEAFTVQTYLARLRFCQRLEYLGSLAFKCVYAYRQCIHICTDSLIPLLIPPPCPECCLRTAANRKQKHKVRLKLLVHILTDVYVCVYIYIYDPGLPGCIHPPV